MSYRSRVGHAVAVIIESKAPSRGLASVWLMKDYHDTDATVQGARIMYFRQYGTRKFCIGRIKPSKTCTDIVSQESGYED